MGTSTVLRVALFYPGAIELLVSRMSCASSVTERQRVHESICSSTCERKEITEGSADYIP